MHRLKDNRALAFAGAGFSAAPGLRVPSVVAERFKTAIDAVIALLLLVLTGPVVLVAMALIKLTSPGPVFYTQTRLGRNGRPFTIYKLRSMTHGAESLTGARWSGPGDVRVTTVGRWLRRTHLDELPQLWNVLKGEMSLIGPRPERPEFVPQLEQAIPHYRARLLVRPGLSGLAQVQLPADTDLESVRVKLAYDLYYLQTAGVWLDFRIKLATVLHMVGIPFETIRKIFRFADRESVEDAYRSLGRPPRPRPPSLKASTGQPSAALGVG